MERKLQPEILDSLAPDDPEALHNRRDLRVINRVMGNFRWFEKELPKHLRPGEKILEIGSGTGDLGFHLAKHGIEVDGLDLWPRPAGWPVSQAWHRQDLRTFPGYGDYRVVIANLILHQFTEKELAEFGRTIREHARVILACEPERRRFWQVLIGAFGPLFGAGRVTRHDAHVSITAGFLGHELPAALGLDPAEWSLRCTSTFLGGYHMTAVRRT